MSKEFIIILVVVIAITIITLGYVWLLFRKVKKIKVSNPKADEIGSYIKEGAMAYLKRQYMYIIPIFIVVAILLAVIGYIPVGGEMLKDKAEGVGLIGAGCFLLGSLFSGLAGFIGMRAATYANSRTACAAEKEGMPSALRVAFSGGAILGLSVVGLGLLGLTILFFSIYGIGHAVNAEFSIQNTIPLLSGYGLGCSMIALFCRVGGGIYTKAADVGADLVGKVEAGIPEDDPRNPAVIADNVGDNVGDIAGMGSDLCESYVGSIISALSLAIATFALKPEILTKFPEYAGDLEKNVLFILMIAGVGIVAAVLSVIFIRAKKWHNPQRTLSIATYVGTGIVLLTILFLSIFYLKEIHYFDQLFVNAETSAVDGNVVTRPGVFAFFAVLVGLIAGILVGKIAEIYTSSDYKQVKEIARQSQTGHATNIIAGFGSGMQSTALTIAVLAGGIIISYFFCGNYGIALAAVGMLSTAGITVAVDAYGPISDNAGGIAEMSNMDHHVREITDKLDSVGNTTAAIGKGFCIGSATFTALALIVAFAEVAGITNSVNLTDARVIIGLLVGAMLPYLFSSLTIKSVGKAANKMIEEVRRQFKEDPGIMAGTSKPDYKKCVDISTKAALKEMILPGVIAIVSPIIAGLVIGNQGLAGLLIGGLASAIMLAVFMANAGGAWDNAKKYIESGEFGGKGSETHKAAVTGDTVGDPFKDTAGPAMDILIKLMSVISLILAPIIAAIGTDLWTLCIDWISRI